MTDPLERGVAFFGAATSALVTGVVTAVVTFFLGKPWCDEPVFTVPKYTPSGCDIQNFDPSCLRYSPPQVCDNFFGFPPIANSTEVATAIGLGVGTIGGIIVFVAVSLSRKSS